MQVRHECTQVHDEKRAFRTRQHHTTQESGGVWFFIAATPKHHEPRKPRMDDNRASAADNLRKFLQAAWAVRNFFLHCCLVRKIQFSSLSLRSANENYYFETCKIGAVWGRQDANLSFIEERSHGFCPVASLVYAYTHYRSMDFWVLAVLAIFKLNFLKEPRGPQLNASVATTSRT